MKLYKNNIIMLLNQKKKKYLTYIDIPISINIFFFIYDFCVKIFKKIFQNLKPNKMHL